MIESSNITELIQAVRDNQDGADERLLSRIYCELHELADGQMSREKAGHTLRTTALQTSRLTPPVLPTFLLANLRSRSLATTVKIWS